MEHWEVLAPENASSSEMYKRVGDNNLVIEITRGCACNERVSLHAF